jgi:hypothetical protein
MYFITCTILLFFLLHPSPAIHQQNPIEIRFSNFAGGKRVSPDSTYVDPFGETYTIQRLKYYITNIEFLHAVTGTRFAIPGSYFLVDTNDEESNIIKVFAPADDYDAISFLLGVDSLHNVSGAQSGALDPVNGMFWTWNSGYVSIKLEGRSPASNLPQHLMEYNLGGFKGPDNVNHRVNLSFPASKGDNHPGKAMMINVKTDVNLFFNAVHSLPIKDNPACTTAGTLARQYSENYAQIFSVDNVEYRQ